MTEHDYYEALKENGNMEIQLQQFGFNENISIEGSTCQYHDKYHNDVSNDGNVKIYFHSLISDHSAQNESNKFEHM